MSMRNDNGFETEEIPLDLQRGLRNFWYPICLSSELRVGEVLAVRRVGEDLVVWRDGDGRPRVLPDRCPHRAVRLSAGDVVQGRLQCRYHGLQYDGTGQCRLVPADLRMDGPLAQRISSPAYETEEQGEMVFAFIGEMTPPPLELDPVLVSDDYVCVVKTMLWECNWLLARDNAPDLAHVPFLHGRYAGLAQSDGSVRFEPIVDPENPLLSEELIVEFLNARLSITDTDRGLVMERVGAPFPEFEWELPNVVKVWVSLAGRTVARHVKYEVPIDEHSTLLFIIASAPRTDDVTLAELKELVETKLWVGYQQAFLEDAWMIASTRGDVNEAHQGEHLLPIDAATLRVRRRIMDEYRRQQSGMATAGSAELVR